MLELNGCWQSTHSDQTNGWTYTCRWALQLDQQGRHRGEGLEGKEPSSADRARKERKEAGSSQEEGLEAQRVKEQQDHSVRHYPGTVKLPH